MKWSAWKSVLAGAVIGFTEAAGPDAARRAVRRAMRPPLRAVWVDDRRARDLLAETGVWFLDPLPDPRPEATDTGPRGPAALVRLSAAGILGLLGRSGSEPGGS